MASTKFRLVQRCFDRDSLELEKYVSEKRLKLIAGSYYIPKPNECKPLGEDAHFICHEEQTIGVADGVGGWATHGIDSGEYARELMSHAQCSVLKQSNSQLDGSPVDLRRVINEAYSYTDKQGSSTACLISLFGHFLHVLNVGDSGFVLIHEGKIVFALPSQQTRFNCPFQLGNMSGSPDVAAEYKVEVKAGDTVVVGTDGLFDNVFGGEIEELVKLGKRLAYCEDHPEYLARIIAKHALVRSKGVESSPFGVNARQAGYQHVGGKPDDVTVIVAHVVD